MESIENRERLWNANYTKVWVANFMIFFSFMLLTPLLPIYLSEHFGADKDTIGVVLFGYAVMPEEFIPMDIFNRVAGGFITLGVLLLTILVVLYRFVRARRRLKDAHQKLLRYQDDLKQSKLQPMRFESTEGFPIYVGSCGRATCRCTRATSSSRPMWHRT